MGGGMPKGGPVGGGMQKGGPMGGGMPMGGPPGGGAARASGQPVPTARPGAPDEVLRDRFRTWAHHSLPQISGVSKLIANDAYGQDFTEDRQRAGEDEEGQREVVYNDLASWVSWVYRWLITLTEDGFALYACLFFFALACIAWLMHRPARGYKRATLAFAAARSDTPNPAPPSD